MFRNLLYTTACLFVRLYALLMFKLDIQRQGKLPPGPKIFVANHPSATDPFIIHLITREPLSVLITQSAFNVPVFGSFLRAIREIPVPLEQGSLALDQARQYIQAGKSVVIFIEGAISPVQGGFLPPRTGAARLALSTGAPIIPVGIYLRRERSRCIKSKISGLQTQGYWYLRGPYALTVGEALNLDGNVDDREYVRQISEGIMRSIRLLAHESENRTRRFRLAPSLT